MPQLRTVIIEPVSFASTWPAILGLQDALVQTIVAVIFDEKYLPGGAFGFGLCTG
jgi:hypothetical protein